MKSVSHKNNWNLGELQVHVEPPRIALIRSDNDEKLYKDCIKINFVGSDVSKVGPL